MKQVGCSSITVSNILQEYDGWSRDSGAPEVWLCIGIGVSSRKYTGAISIGRAPARSSSVRWVVDAKFGGEQAENLGPVLGTLGGGGGYCVCLPSTRASLPSRLSRVLPPPPPLLLTSGGVQAPTPSACCYTYTGFYR